ncbi:unnamed protein product [Clonostachys rhizophaga]|uniref:Zn(2)-C6 fungal-type domain-containing protein n=1 Tax=Clonostachys rhizophaga TaxID=160324 RepID=A0A9N9VGG7_9HYPO|nr:unnamed protein product [Clonostachys rhizophaga]
MPSQPATPIRKRKLRVSAACEFCRRRKLRCDAEPQCENCRQRGEDCTYATREKKARPSNARIHKLEEENARLRQSLQHPQDALEETQAVIAADTISHHDQVGDSSDQPAYEEHEPVDTDHGSGHVVSQPVIHASSEPPQEVAFHGPSSVMFNMPKKQQQLSQSSMTQIKNQLLADATRQRQMEVVNLNNNSLDFDGVSHELGMRLLSLFWNRQYYSGTIVYRPAFMRDMACGGRYFSKLLLNAIYFGASKSLTRPEDVKSSGPSGQRGWSFRNKFDSYLHASNSEALWRSEVTTIQALLIVSDALFTWCDERSLSWHYMGIAVNMIVDLGIHVDGSAGLRSKESCSPEDIEVYRRLFWSAYTFDKVQSIYQGRPSRLKDIDNSVPILFLDEYEEYELFNTLTYSATPQQLSRPTYAVSTFQELCQLSIIMDHIIHSIYSEKSASASPAELSNTRQSIQTALENWRMSLPTHLSIQLDSPAITSVLPHTLSLLSMYNSMVILLHRPFVSDGHLQSTSSGAGQAFSYCATAALEIDKILQLYQKHFCMSTTPYFVSYATYVSATIHVRIAAQRRSDSAAHKCLQRCLDALGEHQTICHAPRQTIKILKGLILRLGVKMDHFPEPVSLDCSKPTASTREKPTQTPRIEDRHHLRSPPDSRSGSGEDNSVPGFTDLDIDEVMRSFAMNSTDPMLPSDIEGQALPALGNLEEGENDLDIDSFLSFDPLFGFNNLF